MKKFLYIIAIVFLMTFLIIPAQADLKKVAQTGLQFLKVDMSPRAAAMGGAASLVVYDATALFYNPAGMELFRAKGNAFAAQTQWIGDIKYNAGAAMYSFGIWGTFGVSMIFADYGDDIYGTQVADNPQGYIETGTVDVGAYAVGLGYAKRLSDKFVIGGQVKYTDQKLGSNLMPDGKTKNNEVSGFAFDFGTIFYPGFKSFRFGMSIRNFAAEYEYERESFELPLTFTISAAMDLLDFAEYENHSVILSFDAQHPRDYSERLLAGLEYWFKDLVAFRTGYKFNYDEESWSFGLGLNVGMETMKLQLDYSYSEFGVFDPINRFSVGFSF